MRSTRSKKIQAGLVTHEKILSSEILTAKKAPSSIEVRIHLRNLTNSTTASEPVKKKTYKKSAHQKMRTLAKDDVENHSVVADDAKTQIPERKRKLSEEATKDEAPLSPIKKLKENEEKSNEIPAKDTTDVPEVQENEVSDTLEEPIKSKEVLANGKQAGMTEVPAQPKNSQDISMDYIQSESIPAAKEKNEQAQDGQPNDQHSAADDIVDDEQPSSNVQVCEQAQAISVGTNGQNNDQHSAADDIVDDEQPSTSKEALALIANSSPFKSLRRQKSNPSIAEEQKDTENATVSDVESKPATRRSSVPLPDKLLLVISNLYLNAAERLKLDFTPRCAEDLEHCHQHHYRAPLPPAPNPTQANNLRNALQQQRYVSFVSWSLDMCHRGDFPGEGIFTKIIELVLSFNSKSSTKSVNNNSLGHFFNKSIELFCLVVRKFPPCWLSLRKFYINFFQTPLDASKLSKKNEPTLKSNNIVEIVLDLLETTLEKCKKEDLEKDGETFELPPKENKVIVETSPEVPQELPANPHSEEIENSMANSEVLNIWDWEEHENRMQTFEALQSISVRLERLFIVLELLLHILECDFVMWILHHHKKAKDWIFCENNRPLIVLVLNLSKFLRSTGVVKHLFKLFSVCVNKGAKPRHIKILERYISLAVVASNVGEMEYSAIGVRYPNLGTETKALILEFFVTFKAHNTSHISSYLNTIEILRIPYVRTEFIDYFLQLFYFPRNEVMSPKKIAFDISKKRWLKYKPQAELNNDDDDEDLSREQYLQLLLKALIAYCEWHGAINFFQLLTKDKTIGNFRAVTDSVHRWPTKGSGMILLSRMRKDINKLEQKLRMVVRMSKPKVELPIADICIDQDVVLKYRTDLKFLVILDRIIAKQSEEAKDVDFTAWKNFLENFTEN